MMKEKNNSFLGRFEMIGFYIKLTISWLLFYCQINY